MEDERGVYEKLCNEMEGEQESVSCRGDQHREEAVLEATGTSCRKIKSSGVEPFKRKGRTSRLMGRSKEWLVSMLHVDGQQWMKMESHGMRCAEQCLYHVKCKEQLNKRAYGLCIWLHVTLKEQRW